MTEFFAEYGLFLLKAITIVAAIVVVIGTAAAAGKKASHQEGLDIGFLEVVAGPLVRSSYRAERVLQKNNVGIAV